MKASYKSRGGSLRVCVIGGGGTGAALAYDLCQRGLSVVLLERGELTSGTTGRHHGQLHSGARYAVADRAIARECYEETLILRRIAAEAIEYNGGLFVALDEDEADFGGLFVAACLESGIPAREIPVARALDLEPALNPAIRRAVWVPDGSFDAFRLPLSFFAAARRLGADIRPWVELTGLDRSDGRIVAARVIDRSKEPFKEYRVEADYFVSATGAWSGRVGAMAGVDVPITPAPGTMLALRGRLCDRVISRLRPAADGDILVPQRGLSIIGSTQGLALDPDSILPPAEDLGILRSYGAQLVPAMGEAPFHAIWAAARPLAGRVALPAGGADGSADDTRAGVPLGATGSAKPGRPGRNVDASASAAADAAGRAISRDFAALDHAERDGVAGFCTLIGGKATVLRAMAEKAADLVCRSLGVEASCGTADSPLPSWREYYSGRPE